MAKHTHSITKTYWFSAAHMLVGHPKCGRMHGHNYRVDVTVAAALHSGSRVKARHNWVMDFADLDLVVKPILERFDHKFIATQADELGEPGWKVSVVARTRDVVFAETLDSTAESLAEWFGYEIGMKLGPSPHLTEVTVWETPKSRATWTP